MAYESPIRKQLRSGSEAIPDKLYFRIGEVARMCEVPAYVLRFWESEFPQLRPNKGGSGQRLFRRRDVEMALRIKGLLYDEGYTIPGARQLLKSEQRQSEPQLPLVADATPAAYVEGVRHVQRELRELLTLLSGPAHAARREGPGRQRQVAAHDEMAERLLDFEVSERREQREDETDG